jgi:hypothetical protein
MNLFRSLGFRYLPDENLLSILERLAEGGYLQNTQQLTLEFHWSRNSRIVEVICSMKNLEKLHLFDYKLTPEVLAHVFQSCSKIIDLYITSTGDGLLEMPEHLHNQLRPSFQRLRYLIFECFIDNDSWPVLLEMLT